MKNLFQPHTLLKRCFIGLLPLLMLPMTFTSCGEDRWAAYAEQTATARWMEDSMRVYYYWKDEIPQSNRLNHFQSPATFFKSMLSSEDKFSSIDSLRPIAATRGIPYTDYSYGFQFAIGTLQTSSTQLAIVLYVAPDSPAAEAGLERGDLITHIGDTTLYEGNIKLLYGAGSQTIGVTRYDAEAGKLMEIRSVALPSARAIDEHPIHYSQLFSTTNGRKVAYLVYNYFSPGKTGTEYDDELRAISAQFKSQQITDLILDLRYNNGGSVSSAQLLSTLIAPASALDQTFCYERFHPSVVSDTLRLSFDSKRIGNGANLNLNKLYVLTSAQTASASELVINCLKPYMAVIQVGATTVGKNVGSFTFTNPVQLIEIHPIVCKLFNANKKSDYENGFKPDYTAKELATLDDIYPWGDSRDPLLSKAMELIDESSASLRSPHPIQTSYTPQLKLSVHSVDHRKTNSVILK